MNSILLSTHLTFVGIWLGCVISEALFERAFLGKGREQELILANLHKRVDIFIEMPAFIAVLITGALMYPWVIESGLLYLKIGLGLIAIVANVYCVWLVFKRAKAANSGQWEDFARFDHAQHRYGAIVLLAIICALVVGLYSGWAA